MHTVFKLAQLRWTGHVIKMPDERLLWRTTGGKALSRWPEDTLQRHPQSLSEGFRHGVLGTDCTGAIKVGRSHQQSSSSLWEKKRESVKLKESAENAKPIPMGHQLIFHDIDLLYLQSTV